MTLRSAAQAVVDAFPPSPGTPRGDALEALREALREEAGVSEREWLPSVEALTDAIDEPRTEAGKRLLNGLLNAAIFVIVIAGSVGLLLALMRLHL